MLFRSPESRVKPWGTAQAILEAKDKITGPFLVINADDFYGRDSYFVARDFLLSNEKNKYSTIGYKAKNTMTKNGSVKRGVIKSSNGNLESITESKLEYVGDRILAVGLETGKERSEEHTSELQSQCCISYAVFCLKKNFFNDTATTEIYTLSLHDALPIWWLSW